mgnify:CR=1 FL=1
MPLISQVGRNHFKVRFLLGAITTLLWIGVSLHLFPVWWTFSTSITPYKEIYKIPPALFPRGATLACYKLIFTMFSGSVTITQPFWVYIKNSGIMTGAIMAIQIPVTALAAYALSKLHDPKWSRLLFLVLVGIALVPYQVSMIPLYFLLRDFPFATGYVPKIPFTPIPFPHYNFINTYWAVILPGGYAAFNLLLFKGFFDGIPDELINAARIDGASEIGIFRRIIIPLSKPVFAVVAYMTFSSSWNQFLWPLIVLKKEKLMPIAVGLYRFQEEVNELANVIVPSDEGLLKRMAQGYSWNGVMAMSLIQSIPVFIMFIIFREQLMKGIKLRGFK